MIFRLSCFSRLLLISVDSDILLELFIGAASNENHIFLEVTLNSMRTTYAK